MIKHGRTRIPAISNIKMAAAAACSTNQQMRPIFTDKEHYFKALSCFAGKSDCLKVIKSWIERDFSPVLDSLECLLEGPEDELKVLGVGSGSGRVTLVFTSL